MTSSHKNSGFEKLLIEIDKRWDWLNADKRLNERRYDQDIEWLKKSLQTEFGSHGMEKLKNKLIYKKNPFSTLYNLKKMILAR